MTALDQSGYQTPTPIQEQAIPVVLAGNDLLACAQTGTGKTASFALPILQHLSEHAPDRDKSPQALILAPTRELAQQIGDNIKVYAAFTKVKHVVVYGGVSINNQIAELRRKPAIVVATPGRLLDLVQQRALTLEHVRYLVLDEADRMLDMGFMKDMQRIVAMLRTKRQTLLFSATMPVQIENFAQSILHKPERINISPVSSTAETISQEVYPVHKSEKILLLAHVIENEGVDNVLVFSRTKYGADKIARKLTQKGIAALSIHGNKSQQARLNALSQFKSGKIRVLVATDIAARGIDIDALKLVVNYDLPNEPETYVHRIGRTGRAGASGKAISFCDVEENEYLHAIEKLTGLVIPAVTDHPYFDPKAKAAPKKEVPKQGQKQKNKNRRRFSSGRGRSAAL